MSDWIAKHWVAVVAVAVLVSIVGFSLGNLPASIDTPSPTPSSIRGSEGLSAATGNPPTVEHANEADFARLVLQSEVPVLVDFYADWCGPCQELAPVLDEVARETPDARVVKVNVDHSPRLAAQYGISAIPSVMVFRGGKVAAQHTGLASKSELKSMLN
jgi:thioredoxin 1